MTLVKREACLKKDEFRVELSILKKFDQFFKNIGAEGNV